MKVGYIVSTENCCYRELLCVTVTNYEALNQVVNRCCGFKALPEDYKEKRWVGAWHVKPTNPT